MHRGRVGVVRGTTGHFLAAERLVFAEVVQFSSPERAVNALKASKIDLLFHDSPMVLWLAARHEGDELAAVESAFSRECLAWAVARGDNSLRSRLNAIVERWHADGTLEKMVREWVPN
jgi:polar amino acid transport system substrate-binding protein